MIPSSAPVHDRHLLPPCKAELSVSPCILLFLSSLSVIISHGQCYQDTQVVLNLTNRNSFMFASLFESVL